MLTPFQLARASIKKEKKSYVMTFIIMVISLASILTMSNSIENYRVIDNELKNITYGNYAGCYFNMNERSQENIKKMGKGYELAVVYVVDNEIATYDETFFKNSAIQLLEGTLPTKKNEMVVVESLQQNIGDTYSINGEDYTITGIINNYHENYTLPSFTGFTGKQKTQTSYSYLTGEIDIATMKNEKDFVLNHGRLAVDTNAFYQGGSKHASNVDNQKIILDSFDASMNIVIIFVCVALLFVGFDEKRTERIYFYKSLGMTNGQTYSYAFYESIFIACIALLIAWPIAMVLSYGLCLYNNSIYHVHVPFMFHWYSQFISILLCMIMVGLSSFMVVYMINIRAFDSLIYRKRRTKMKKYNKARRMNTWHIFQAMNSLYPFGIGFVLSAVILSSLNLYTMISVPEELSQYQDNKTLYGYHVTTNQALDEFSRDITYIKARREKRMNIAGIYDEQGDYYALCNMLVGDVNDYNYTRLDGRMPENENECLLIKTENEESLVCEEYEEFYHRPLDIGEVLNLEGEASYNDVGKEPPTIEKEYTVVGIGYVDEGIQVGLDIGTIVGEDFDYVYELEANGSLLFELPWKTAYVEEYVHVYKEDINIDFMYACLTLMISIVFLIVGMFRMVKDFQKEITIYRCLGMDKSQVLQLAHFNYGFVVLYCAAHMFILRNATHAFVLGRSLTMTANMNLLIASGCLLVFYVIYMSLILHAFKDEVYFTPTDVKRFY